MTGPAGIVYVGEAVGEEPASARGEGMEWNAAIGEWAEGSGMKLVGQLRQARAAAGVGRRYGQGSMRAFATEVKCSLTRAYDYGHVWKVYGERIEAGELSGRLESGKITMSLMIECSYAPDPMLALDRAEDEDHTSRQAKAERQQESIPENVEVVDMIACAKCGEVYPMREANTWSEEARSTTDS